MTARIHLVNPAPTPEQVEAWQSIVKPKVLKYQVAIACVSGLLVTTIWFGLVWFALTRT